jgi:hypothetical protein
LNRDRHDRKGGCGNRLRSEVTEILQGGIDDIYLSEQRNSGDAVYYQVAHRINRKNEFSSDTDKLHIPSRATVYRAIASLDKFDEMAARFGKRVAQMKFRTSGLSSSQPLAARTVPLEVDLDERGLLPIHDARHLSDGHSLLALDESGVMRIDRHGRQLAHYPIPAHCLVLAESGHRALALARRDNTFRVSRVDLLIRNVSDWVSLPFAFWAEQYDGVTWNVVLDNRLIAVDTTQDRLAVT